MATCLNTPPAPPPTPPPAPPRVLQACGWSGQAATYRYVVALLLEDASAASYGTAFQDQAQKILEKSADEMKVNHRLPQPTAPAQPGASLRHAPRRPRRCID